MTAEWSLHWLNASGSLAPWQEAIGAEIEAARTCLSQKAPVPRLDLLLQRAPANVIPELGMGGYAYHSKLLSLSFDPDNPHFETALRDGAVRRTVLHEVHHCLRMAGPGYGRTLGEALVSEGLAGQFVGFLMGSPPELWERALDEAELDRWRPTEDELRATRYDHADWFFGRGGERPRWLGYTLGYRLVGRWLAAAGEIDWETWVNVPAQTVLEAGLDPLRARP